jgi:hypothetical protein
MVNKGEVIMAGDEIVPKSETSEEPNRFGHTRSDIDKIAVDKLQALLCSVSVQDVSGSNPRLAHLNALMRELILSGRANTEDLLTMIKKETAFVDRAGVDVSLTQINQLHPDVCPTDNECQKKRNQAYSMDPSASV